MEKIINIVQLITAVVLIVLILIQQRGTALGGAFGGAGNVYRTKRGVEKLVFRATILFLTIFILLSLANLAF